MEPLQGVTVRRVRPGPGDKAVYSEMRTLAFPVSAQRQRWKPVPRKNSLRIDFGDFAEGRREVG